MCEFASKNVTKYRYCFIKIVSIPDEEYFSETAIGCTVSYLSKLYDVSFGFEPPPLHLGSVLLFDGRRRVAVARYRMICLVHLIPNDPLVSDPPGMGACRVINAMQNSTVTHSSCTSRNDR